MAQWVDNFQHQWRNTGIDSFVFLIAVTSDTNYIHSIAHKIAVSLFVYLNEETNI
jgi:hypothetical protein